jgi:hypothetical protein
MNQVVLLLRRHLSPSRSIRPQTGPSQTRTAIASDRPGDRAGHLEV